MKIGCHAVLFTDKIASDTEGVLQGFEVCGCQGVEIGARFFGVEKNRYLKDMLKKYNLELSGLHVSFLWTDLLDDVEKIKLSINGAVEFLQVMEQKNIILTGMATPDPSGHPEVEADSRLSDPEAVKNMVVLLNEIAKEARAGGVSINYHNHCWEFEENALLYYSILTYAPDIKFGLDTGWAAISGYSPITLIQDNPDRFSYVHLRDYKNESVDKSQTFAEKQEGYVDLGTGDMDFEALLPVLSNCLGPDGWAVIEYEKGSVDFSRYKSAVEYIKGIVR